MNDVTEIKEKINILLKSCLDNDRITINKIYTELKEHEDVQISLIADYDAVFKLNVSYQDFDMDFSLKFGEDHLPF